MMILPFQGSFDLKRANSEDKLADRWHLILVIISFVFIIRSSFCMANDTLLPGETLSGNQTLVSKNGLYQFGLYGQSLMIFAGNFSGMLLWSANLNNPVELDGPKLSISSTGNLVLTQSHDQKLVWSTNLTRSEETNTTTVAVLLDTGNLVLKEESDISRIVWQSFDYPTDTWCPGAPLGFEADTGKNIHLTSMNYFGHTYILELDPRRARGFIIRRSSSIAAYHGTFPQLIDIVDDGSDLVMFNDIVKNHTVVQLDSYGFVNIYYWANDPLNFERLWLSPNSQCDYDSICGPYSLCSGENYATCFCPYGFHPAYPDKWKNADFSGGCSRNITLSCEIHRSGSFDDVFFQIDNITTYPDDPQLLVLKDEAECKAACLNNCSCSAYSYNLNCSLWFGELKNTITGYDEGNGEILNIRLHILTSRHSRKAHRFTVVSVIGIITFLAVLLLISWKCKAIGFVLKRRAIIGDELVAYSYAETKSITKNFLHKLGEGGFVLSN